MNDNRAHAQINDGSYSPAQIHSGFVKMADRLDAGGRIVVGVNGPLEEGFIIGRAGERHLAIKRRATRQEFVDTIPECSVEERKKVEAMHAPFYYELEVWDRVLEGSDGMQLGIRIHQVRRA